MLIVTEQAEARALQMLEKVAMDPQGWRCLYLKPLEEVALDDSLTRAITQTFQRYLTGLAGGIFFSGTGHTWAIYKNELSPSQAAQLLSELRGHFFETQLEGIYHYDLRANVHQVIHKIERLILPQSAAAPKPKVDKYSGTVAERLVAFLQEVPAGTARQLANQRLRRSETVVLAVEDDPFYSRLIEKVLAPHARVIVTAQADQVMEEYVIAAPDVVLMDIGLPEVSGHQLLKTILQLDDGAYIVMASGNSFKDDVMGAMQNGAKGFITKPFTREKLIKAINQSPTVKKQIV